jgi:hypothetical protein
MFNFMHGYNMTPNFSNDELGGGGEESHHAWEISNMKIMLSGV